MEEDTNFMKCAVIKVTRIIMLCCFLLSTLCSCISLSKGRNNQDNTTSMNTEIVLPPKSEESEVTGGVKPRMEWNDGELYYYDDTGEIDCTETWRKVNEFWYYIGPEGYAIRNRWKGLYYLLDDGKMAVNQYIDRFYVNEDGVWEYNNWETEHWLVNGNWIFEDGKWYFQGDGGIRQLIDLSGVRSINRLGYNTLNDDGMPQQSLVAYQAAIEHGFSILLCDLRFTSDGQPVCFHDAYINQKARNMDGSEIVELKEDEKLQDDKKIFVSDSTLEQLQQYDYGVYRGEQYSGITILTLEAMLPFCQDNEVDELYIEIKEGTDEQIQDVVRYVNKFNITVSWAASTYDQAKAVVKSDPCARISLMPDVINDEVIDELISLKTGSNEVFIFAYGNAILTAEIVDQLRANDISFEMGTIDSEQEILNYWNGAYYYCSGIESDVIVASTIDVGKVLEEAESK